MVKAMGLIALVGGTGSGKSSLINLIVGEDCAAVGDKLDSVTSEVDVYAYALANGTNVRIVDTPGFNDFRSDGTAKSDLEILQMIAKFLKSERDSEQKFSGIIYTHNITSPRVDRMMRRNMTIFKKLCGHESMKNVVVVTTFWDMLDDVQVGIDNERELQTEAGLLKELYDGGAKFVRAGQFDQDQRPSSKEFPTTQEIVDYFLSLDPVYVRMQKEMDAGASIADTGAGSSLLQEFEALKRECKESIEDMKSQMFALRSASEEDRSHRDILKAESQRLKDQLSTWEAHGREMETKMHSEMRQIKVAAKDEFEVWQNAHREDFEGLCLEVADLKQAKNDANRHQVTLEQRNAELVSAFAKVEKECDGLSGERRELQRNNRHLQDLYIAQIALTNQREAEKSALKDEVHELQIKLSQSPNANVSKRGSFKTFLLYVKRLREELKKSNAEWASLQSEHRKTKIEVARLTAAAQNAHLGFEVERKKLIHKVLESQKVAAESRNEAQRLLEENGRWATKLNEGARRTNLLPDELHRTRPSGSPLQEHSPSLTQPSQSSSVVSFEELRGVFPTRGQAQVPSWPHENNYHPPSVLASTSTFHIPLKVLPPLPGQPKGSFPEESLQHPVPRMIS